MMLAPGIAVGVVRGLPQAGVELPCEGVFSPGGW